MLGLILIKGHNISFSATLFQFEDFSLSGPGQWIEIRDGNSREAPLIGRYTGDGVFDIIVSGGPSLHIHLQTDLHSRARGFNFTYQNGKMFLGADQGYLGKGVKFTKEVLIGYKVVFVKMK